MRKMALRLKHNKPRRRSAGKENTMTQNGQSKIYQMVTDRIIEELEKGIIPWQKPWTGCKDGAYNYKTGRVYCMMNQFVLKHRDGYVTFNQCKSMGGHVKKGAKAEVVFEWIVKTYAKKDENGDPELDENGQPVHFKKISLTYDKVFWIGDCEGLPEKKEEVKESLDPIADAEAAIADYVKRSGIGFQNDQPSDRAYYSPFFDKVVVPMLDQYKAVEEYYSTTFHELTHSTGHQSRLNRFEDDKAAAFGSETYSKEELVAELGAATLVNYFGIESTKSFRNSAAYIQSWLKVLKNDPKFIVSASARAEKAVALILNK